MNRIFAALTIAFLWTTAAVAAGPANVADVPTGQAAKGEPYELGGKRLVFTTWQFVRPGYFGWINEKGENVSVAGNENAAEARFVRGDAPYGIRLVAQPARREGRIWHREVPADESGGMTIATVLQDGDVYKAWGVDYGGEQRTVYYESDDGRHWTRRDVRFTLDGDADNTMNLGEGTIFIDPSASAEERYKSVTLDHFDYAAYEKFQREHPDRWEPLAKREDVGFTFYIRGYTSPDGFNWKSLPEPLSVEHSDTQIVAYYDTRRAKYVIYTRTWMVDPKSPATQAAGQPFHMVGRRSIGRTESSDFKSFPVSRVIMVPSPDMAPYEVLYTNARTALPEAPFNHLMFPTIWRLSDDATSVRMASSYNGDVFDFIPGGDVFETAPFGAWDGGCVFARPNLIELADGTFALPYTGYNVPHKYPRGKFKFATGYMTWPKGRIVAVQADEIGAFSTVGFIAPGGRLLVNADVRRAGSLKIEIADIHGQVVPGRSFDDCETMFGDLYKHPVAWKNAAAAPAPGSLGVAAGTPIILRFKMDRAKLFGLDFE